MAVKDEIPQYPTDSLILNKARKHYRIPVRSQHWQLRSLISAEKQDILYFPGGTGCNHILRLNTTTHECETIKLLTFSPRCLVAENGWVCCGGETGEFTAIQLDDSNSPSEEDVRVDTMDPDARLPITLDSPRQDESIFSIIARTRRSNKSLIAKSEKLAHERVNCITLWFPPKSTLPDEAVYTEPVAVLANNDKTVTLVSLRDFEQSERTEPLDVINYPDFVNRAIISPDGRILVAILDDPFLYVNVRGNTRVERSRSRSSRFEKASLWQPCRAILLRSQRKDDGSDSRGSFAACFSSSGAYLAVGTQYGTISIFDTKALTDPTVDPLITSFKSSRAEMGPGAVRDMAFSPGPYDLLAWTEDRGHIGIADLRSNFATRQILDINAEDAFEHISILDRNTIDPRLLNDRSDGLATHSIGGLNISENRRRRDTAADRINMGLTPEETIVLEALQDQRRRRELAEQRVAQRSSEGTPGPATTTPWSERAVGRATNGTSAWTSRERSSSVSRALGGGAATRERSSSLSRALGDLLVNMRDRRDTRERAQERALERVLDSVVQDRAGLEQRRGTISIRRANGQTQTLNLSSGLTDLQTWYNMTREATFDPETRNTPGSSRRERERDRDTGILLPLLTHIYHPEWDEYGNLSRHPGVHESPPQPDNTAGLSWSEDGRTLFVGAENGIYEFHVNAQARKFCPSINMR